jgi:crotonobetainyl-CoA:carnitine CoA-transferase CaiB-like acyl-CoA transferase
LEDRTPWHRRRYAAVGPPFLRKDGGIDTTESAYFLSANRGKHSICVDISTDEGSAIVRALAQQADLVIENYKVGDMARYGLDYEALKRVKPDNHLLFHHRLWPDRPDEGRRRIRYGHSGHRRPDEHYRRE